MYPIKELASLNVCVRVGAGYTGLRGYPANRARAAQTFKDAGPRKSLHGLATVSPGFPRTPGFKKTFATFQMDVAKYK